MASVFGNVLTLFLVVFGAINVLGSIGDFGFPEAGEDDVSKQNADVRYWYWQSNLLNVMCFLFTWRIKCHYSYHNGVTKTNCFILEITKTIGVNSTNCFYELTNQMMKSSQCFLYSLWLQTWFHLSSKNGSLSQPISTRSVSTESILNHCTRSIHTRMFTESMQ